MTQYPEAYLVRELGMAVVNIALIRSQRPAITVDRCSMFSSACGSIFGQPSS